MALIDLTNPILASGHSDDCVEIDGPVALEAYLYDGPADVVVNGTRIATIEFDPDRSGNWRITPTAPVPGVTLTIVPALGEDAEHVTVEPYLHAGTVRGYSDYAVITGVTVKDEHADL